MNDENFNLMNHALFLPSEDIFSAFLNNKAQDTTL